MIPILSLLVVLTLSVLVTRVAALALIRTGLGRESARFRARSAFTAVGFTTSESEGIVAHPARRPIVSGLMLFGNVGSVTVVSSLLLSFIGMSGDDELWQDLAPLCAGLATLWIVSASNWVDRRLNRPIGCPPTRPSGPVIA